MTPPLRFIEPFAGSGAVSLQLIGGKALAPISSWMGGKRRLAPVILRMMGLYRGCGARALHLNDVGPWGAVWPLLMDREKASALAQTFYAWHDEGTPIQALWERFKEEGPQDNDIEDGARWLLLQSRSANGTPLFWDDGGQLRYSNGHSIVLANQKGRNSQGWSGDEEDRDAPDVTPGWGGLIRIATLGERVEAIGRALEPIDCLSTTKEAGLVQPLGAEAGTYVYLDPPYKGSTGYGFECPRSTVLTLAESWARAGAVVAVSEAEGLQADLGSGWSEVDITPEGSAKAEWLTCYPPPNWSPARQLPLWEARNAA